MTEKYEPHTGHRQRLRDRAAAEGLDSFEPHQVMELMLFYAIPRQDVSELAHELIRRFGSVAAVLRASREELMQVSGVGKRTAEWLMGLGETVDAYCNLRDDDQPHITSFANMQAFCRNHRRQMTAPAAYHVCMTPSGKILTFGKICDSLHWGDAMIFRKSIQEVLAAHARSVIVILFSGDGIPEPTGEDVRWAQDYAYLLQAMNTLLLDVVLVGEDSIVSMRQKGLYVSDEAVERRYGRIFRRYLREESDIYDEPEMPETDSGL